MPPGTPAPSAGQPLAGLVAVLDGAPRSGAPPIDFHAWSARGGPWSCTASTADPNYQAWRSKAMGSPQRVGNLASMDGAIFTTVALPPTPVEMPTAELAVVGSTRRVRTFETATEVEFVPAPFGTAAVTPLEVRAMTQIQQARVLSVNANPTPMQVPTAVGGFLVSRSQRNPTPLFGIGLIDAIPDEASRRRPDAASPGSPRSRGGSAA
ncbi:MAG: hypothetical protein WKF75_01895 [Singulisphaera sp.]